MLASTPILIMESADITAPAVASSRIFIKGLPPTISEEEFKKHFGVKYPITDAKLISNRRIGYVGYKTPEEAAKAVKYFNKSFIRMSKIGVELARPVRFLSIHFFTMPANVWLDIRFQPTNLQKGTTRARARKCRNKEEGEGQRRGSFCSQFRNEEKEGRCR